MQQTPQLIEFNPIGSSALGYICVAEKNTLPFTPHRIYWTYYTPESVVRGNHAHYELEQILVAVAGKIIVTTEMPGGIKNEFILDSPDKGLFIPKRCWRVMKYSHTAVQMCIASIEYHESDYIRDYDTFKQLK